MSYYYDAIAACDFDNPNNTDYSRYCSGACNTALTSAAAACTSPEHAQIKAMAEQSLAVCSSGCMSHATSFASACPGVMTMDDPNEGEDGMATFLTAHAVVCGGGACYDLLTQA